MFDGLFQSDTDRALALEAESPRVTPKKPPGFFTGMGTALIEGPTQGTLEGARNVVGAGQAIGQVGRAVPRIGFSADTQMSGAEARDVVADVIKERESELGVRIGRQVRAFDPDPETSSTAAQIVHQFGRIGVKIAGAAAVGGAAGVPPLLGLEEGLTEATKLRDKGVDPATAARAGAVHGIATAAAAAVPMAGRTILQTVGLASVSGPGAFIAEQATIREILRDADYSVQAAEYDPFDVLGLTVSTLGAAIPGIGANLVRGRRAAAPAPAPAPTASAPAPAAPAAPVAKPPDEVVDAARVELLNQHDMDLVQGNGPEAVQAHAEGRAEAVAKIERGEPLVTPEPVPAGAAVLQNRDRSTTASVAQMQAIAAAPDYLRLSPGRQLAEGTPVVIAEAQVPATQLGARDVAVDARGGRVDVQYAVVEAEQLLGSHNASGIANPAYGPGAAGQLRAVAGNARVAGLQRGYEMGTTAAYREALAADASHGIPADVIKGMRRPVLVRLMPADQVTADIGDRTNVAGVSALSTVDQAANDAQRVKLEAIEFAEDGSPTPDAVKRFVQGMPAPEQAGLIDRNGAPTRQAVDRLLAATFKKAYGDDELVNLYAAATDPEARNVINGLGQAAGAMARLEGAGDLDIRPAVVAAAKAAVNARRAGVKLEDFAKQVDLESDPVTTAVTGIFARNARSPKKIATELQEIAGFIADQVDRPAADMFGDVPKPTRADVVAKIEGKAPRQVVAIEEASIPRTPAGRLAPDQVQVEMRFAREIAADPEGMLARYDALPEADGGRVINTDVARELSTDYVADRARHAASVHEPASWLMTEKYDRALKVADQHNRFTFLAGGGGSGKGTATQLASDWFAQSSTIVDTTLSNERSSLAKIAAALDAGKKVQIVMVLREPVDAMMQGVVPRAVRSGRTVPLRAFLDAHEGANRTVRKVAQQYEGDERVNVRVVDNRGGPGTARVADLSVLDEVDYNGLEQTLLAQLKAEHEAGRIPPEIYRAIVGDQAADGQRSGGPDSAGSGRRDQPRDAAPGSAGPSRQAGGRPQEVTADPARLEAPEPPAAVRGPVEQDPNVRAALQVIEARGDFELELEDGTRISARQAMDDAAAAVKQAETDSKAFSAAVECALGAGA
jgi:hypothetical protein